MKLKYTKFQIVLETIGLILIVGMIIFVYTQWDQIPQQVPMHYNAMGEIDSWGSKYEILFLPAISILLYVFITAVSFFPQIWNVPVRITDENKEAVYLSSKDLLIIMKVGCWLLGLCHCRTVTAQPLPLPFYLFL